jgi:hypothetical protein
MVHDSAVTTYVNPDRAPWALSGSLSNFVLNSDPRLSDARTPVAHTHDMADVTGLGLALDAKAAAAHSHALSDLEQSGAATNDVATWNGSAWVPAAGAGVSDGDKGDITVSGGGATWTIDNSVVTNAKLRDSAGISVLGRASNSTGPVADITSGTAVSILNYLPLIGELTFTPLSTSGVVRVDTFTGLSSGTVATNEIADNAVTYGKMQDLSAASRLLGRGSAAGAGDPEEITLGTNLSMSGTTLNASGGGGGSSATTVEVDLGSPAKWTGKFTITDAAISASSKVLCWQAPGPYTGKGTRADEAELQPVSVLSVEPGTGSAVVKWQTPPMIVLQHRASAGGQPASAIVPGLKDANSVAGGPVRRVGMVRGNVKFSYMVLA